MVGKASKEGRKPRMTKSNRAGIVFPVARIHKQLKASGKIRIVRDHASVFLAGMLEYLVAEVMDIAGGAAKQYNRQRITPRHLLLAIRGDEELDKLMDGISISQGGVVPHLHPALLPKGYKKGENPLDLDNEANGVQYESAETIAGG